MAFHCIQRWWVSYNTRLLYRNTLFSPEQVNSFYMREIIYVTIITTRLVTMSRPDGDGERLRNSELGTNLVTAAPVVLTPTT